MKQSKAPFLRGLLAALDFPPLPRRPLPFMSARARTYFGLCSKCIVFGGCTRFTEWSKGASHTLITEKAMTRDPHVISTTSRAAKERGRMRAGQGAGRARQPRAATKPFCTPSQTKGASDKAPHHARTRLLLRCCSGRRSIWSGLIVDHRNSSSRACG